MPLGVQQPDANSKAAGNKLTRDNEAFFRGMDPKHERCLSQLVDKYAEYGLRQFGYQRVQSPASVVKR